MWTITGKGPDGQNCEVTALLVQDDVLEDKSSKGDIDYNEVFEKAKKNADKMFVAENKKNFKDEVIILVKEIETAELENI